MLTSAQIRQSFLDFFRERQHTLVPSSSLLPDSPNLLFTNAGMNQFVPIFLGERRADVDAWSGAVKGSPKRAADTQKCIRAGGKHNDLDDVGLDTYHHTFFEMLGNWSFGDYFKKEAIAWAWELIVERWGFPASRLYATIYQPNKEAGDPSERDEEAWGFWAEKFHAAGLDPAVHIVNGNKKDNFWMMGETGPCGPCSELHVDLTPLGDTKGALVNSGDARCIEIWNLVFIQFNANVDGTFSPLPAQHVDTGMGFERVTSIIQGTKNFTDFANAKISNYETDIFRPIFDELEKMSGQRYGSTLPLPNAAGQVIPESEQEKVDVAFRVIADHIRTLSFAVADGIQPGNSDRHYVLRRILRRAVRYGRTLGFREPFFYKLVSVLAREMGEVFPELRTRQKHIEETLKREEEAFNKTLDKGITLFEAEAARLLRGAPAPPRAGFDAPVETSSQSDPGAKYYKRRLPHFERPWGKYAVTFSTKNRQVLSAEERDLVMQSILYAHDHGQYELYAACVMPDHAHLLFEPQIKANDADGAPIFWSLPEILQGIKSTSAHRINAGRGEQGMVWEKESFDRLIRSEHDLAEKFHYICRNPWTAGAVSPEEGYPWVWTWEMVREVKAWFDAASAFRGAPAPSRAASGAPAGSSSDTGEAASPTGAARAGDEVSAGAPKPAREGAGAPRSVEAMREESAGSLSAAFAFRLYDEQGFPLDLTELMARERGLTVDTAGFEKLMEEQRMRARAAQKKTVIELSEIETKEATHFIGYDHNHTGADVREVLSVKGKTAVIANNSVCYAEMGGQVGDTGTLTRGADTWRIANTQKSGNTWLHFLEEVDAPAVGDHVTIALDLPRRAAIQRHHSVTHILHWALHEIVSHEATQKGSFVGPDKLTFDFNSAALTPQQVRDIERLVNERIVENSRVSWIELPYAEVRRQRDIMQFFGDKYGETVRVVQIGGEPTVLNGFSMELCAGTHVRGTGEIGLFRIVSEGAVAAGVRRIEAVAGLPAYDLATHDAQRLATLAGKLGTPVAELEKRIDAMLAQQKELERALKAASQREAAGRARELLDSAETIGGTPAIIANLGGADGDTLQSVTDALKAHGFKGVTVLGGTANGAVALVASVSSEFIAKVQAGKIISAIAPLVGGKGGGKPEAARGGGKDPSQLDAALAHARTLLN